MKKILLVLLVLFGLETQAQTSTTPLCDSLEWTVLPSGSPVLVLQGECSVPWNVFPATLLNLGWSVCTYTNVCYSEGGQTATFPQFTAFDTLKVCMVTILEINSVTYMCEQCDTLVFNELSLVWESIPPSTITTITEINSNPNSNIEDNRMFDILGREFKTYGDIPYGTIYIKNRNKFLKIK